MTAPIAGLQAHANHSPERVAVAFEPVRDALAPATCSYGELDARSRALAGHLRSAGLKLGETVALLCENRIEFLESCWAAQRAGLLYVPIPTGLTEAEARFLIEDSAARVLISTDRQADLATAIAPDGPGNLLVGGRLDGFGDYEAAISSAAPLVDQREGAPLLYSSGTSGRPKGIQPSLPQVPWDSDDALAARFRTTYSMEPGDVFLSPAPLYHSAPLLYCMAAHRVGATVVLLDRFDARGALEVIERWRVTHSQWVPTMFQRLLDLPLADRDRFDLSSHRVAIHGAAPCPVEMKQRLIDWWGPIVWEYYSASERVGVTSISPMEWLAKPGSVGRGIVGTPHICDENGDELPSGEIGTVWFSGGPDFSYRNAPDQTAATRNSRGWRTVHDLGWLDDDDYLFLADRRSDLIITGGINVYPREVEIALLAHSDVGDVAVVGVPDERFGSSVIAIVEPAPGRTVDIASLAAHCSEHLATYKHPKRIVIVDRLPRTDTGKLRRRDLIAQFESTQLTT